MGIGIVCVGMYSNICALRGKIHAAEWCYEDVGSCEVQQVARCNFLCPLNLIKTMYMCVCE